MRVLVIGGTGHVGRAVVRRLAEQSERLDVRVMVRNPEEAKLPPTVEMVRGDLSDRGSLVAALAEVDRVFLLWPLGPGELAENAVALVGAHARRVVYLSAIGVDDQGAAASDPIMQFHTDIEQAIRRTGLEWTFVRSGGMATNTLGWAAQIRAESRVSWVYGDGARALVHENDLADIIVLALLTDALLGRAPQITGPSVLTQQEQAGAIGEAIGRTVAWDEIGAEQVRDILISAGWPAAAADGALRAWSNLIDQPEIPTVEYEAITGRPGRSFQLWAADHAEDFR